MPLLKIDKNRFQKQWKINVNMWMVLRAVSYLHMLGRYIGFTAPLYILKRNNNTVWICKIIIQNYQKTTYEDVSKNHQK